MLTPITGCNVKSPNFNGYYVVKVSKDAFETPEECNKCAKLFNKKLDKYTGKNIFSKRKTSSILESCSFETAHMFSKKWKSFGYKTLSNLKSALNLSIIDAADEDSFTFRVYTKDDKNKADKVIKENMYSVQAMKSMNDYMDRYLLDHFGTENFMAMSRIAAMCGVALDADIGIRQAMRDVPVTDTFKIENLDELRDVVKKMDY